MKNEEKKPEPPPPPPPPKQEPPKVEITKFTPPKIVKDEEVKPDEEIKEVEKLEDTKIGTFNQEGAKDEGLVAPPVEKGTGVVEAPKVEEDYDKVFTVVQIPAEFPGGTSAWTRYLERNLNRDIPSDNGAPPNRYTVIVSFTVSKTGAISDVSAENDPGYGTKAEAIRVITKGPAWKPAVQNGRNVIYRHKQSITFVVSDDQ
jgi:protein TonB